MLLLDSSAVTLLTTSNTWFTFRLRLRLHRASVFSSRARNDGVCERILISCLCLRIFSVMMMFPEYIMDDEIGYQISFPMVTITYLRFHVDMKVCDAFLRRIPHFRISPPCSNRAGFWSVSTHHSPSKWKPIISNISKAQVRNTSRSSRIKLDRESRISEVMASRRGDVGYVDTFSIINTYCLCSVKVTSTRLNNHRSRQIRNL